MTAHIETFEGLSDAINIFVRNNPEEGGKLLIIALGNAVNGMSERDLSKGMLQGFITEHNTIQQGIVRTFCKMLGQWVKSAGSNKHGIDPRNEAAFEFASKYHDEPMPFI